MWNGLTRGFAFLLCARKKKEKKNRKMQVHEKVVDQIAFACREGNMGAVSIFLESGSNPNGFDGWGSPCLTLACGGGFFDVADALISKGADPNIRDRRGRSALVLAARSGRLDLVELLTSNGAIVGVDELCAAARGGSLSVLHELLRVSDDVAALGTNGGRGRSPLAEAAHGGHDDVLKFILLKLQQLGALDVDKLKDAQCLARASCYDIIQLYLPDAESVAPRPRSCNNIAEKFVGQSDLRCNFLEAKATLNKDPDYWLKHNDAKLLQYVNDNGFAVIIDALEPQEVEDGMGMFWDLLESVSCGKISRNDADSLQSEWFPRCYGERGKQNGIWIEGNVFHSPFMWFSRTRPKVLEVFRKMYADDHLLVSFDRLSVIRNEPAEGKKSWWHIDFPNGESPPPWQCFQAFVNYIDCCDDDSPCLRVIPGSHKAVTESSKLHWNTAWKVTLENLGFSEKDAVFVRAPAGSLVIWSCGLVHDSFTRIKFEVPNVSLRRCVAYVNFCPVSFASTLDLEIRKAIFERGGGTDHWPARFLRSVGGSRSHERPRLGLPVLKDFEHDTDALVQQFGQIVLDLVGYSTSFY